MKSFCVAVLLLLGIVECHAFAKWLRLGEDARAEVYIDLNNIQQPSSHVKAWTLLSFKSPQRGGWSSERRLFVYSCKDQKLEWLQSQYYDDRLGDGLFMGARTFNRFGVSGLTLGELDPSTTSDKANYQEAVPESKFLFVFKQFC
jgi:hypothetical protein